MGPYRLVNHPRGRISLDCVCGGSSADLVEIDLRWAGRRYTITHDRTGQRFPGLPHALRALEAIRFEIDHGQFDPALWASQRSNRLLWENYLADYLAHEEARLLPDRRATMDKKRALARHMAWFNGRNVREIHTGLVEDFMALPCLRMACSPHYLADLAGELRFIFRQGVRRNEIERAPQVPVVTVPEKAIQWLTADQQDKVWVCIPQEHRPIFDFLRAYGCRPGEACALCWDRVDRVQGTVTISRTLGRDRKLAERTKTGRVNVLPIMDELATLLDSVTPGIGQTPVFRNPRARGAGYYTQDFLLSVWKKALQASGLKLRVPLKNATRHSLGMQLHNERGVSLEMVGRIFGHTSPQHTRKYARAEVEAVRDALSAPKIQPIRPGVTLESNASDSKDN